MTASLLEQAASLLAGWKSSVTPVHFSFKNISEGWHVNVLGLFNKVELCDGKLRLQIDSFGIELTTSRFEKISIFNPSEKIEGIVRSQPEQFEHVTYVSDKAMIVVLRNDDGTAGHSILGIFNILDSDRFSTA